MDSSHNLFSRSTSLKHPGSWVLGMPEDLTKAAEDHLPRKIYVDNGEAIQAGPNHDVQSTANYYGIQDILVTKNRTLNFSLVQKLVKVVSILWTPAPFWWGEWAG